MGVGFWSISMSSFMSSKICTDYSKSTMMQLVTRRSAVFLGKK